MNDIIKKFLQLVPVICIIMSQALFAGCKDDDSKEFTEEEVPETGMDAYIAQMNQDISDLRLLADGQQRVLTYFLEADGSCMIEPENSHILKVYSNVEEAKKKTIPVLGINEDGYWIYEFYGAVETLTGADGNPVAALGKTGKGVFTPRLRLNAKKYWEVSFNDTQWRQLGNQPAGKIESAVQAAYSPFYSFTTDEDAKTISLALRCGGMNITSAVLGKGTTEAWNKFLAGSSDNVLLDFSYAGYKHGEVGPPDGFSLDYEVMNVKERMKAKGLTAREALIDILQEKNMTRKDGKNGNNPNARIVIYFPEGEYVLHNEEDNGIREPESGKTFATDSKGNNTSYSIPITGGHFVLSKVTGRIKRS